MIFRRPWTRQPPVFTGLARGISASFAYNAAAGPIDQASGASISGATRAVLHGAAVLTGTASATSGRYGNVDNRSAFTVVGVTSRTGTYSTQYLRLDCVNGYGWRLDIADYGGTINFLLKAYWAATVCLNVSVTFPADKMVPWALAIDTAALTYELFVQGTSMSSGSLSAELDPVRSTNPPTLTFLSNADDGNRWGALVLLPTADKTRAKEFSARPWQLFAPLPRRIWVPSAGAAVSAADGSADITFGVTGTGSARGAGAGSTTITIDATAAGSARASAAGSTAIAFGITGAGVARISSAASAGISFDAQGVGASSASGAGSASIVLSQTGIGAASQGAAGSTSITLDALGAGAASVVAAGSTAIVFDAQGVGASVALGSAAGSIDIALGVQGVGASRASGDGSTSIVLSQAGEGASRGGAAGSTGLTFDVSGAGAASVGAAGSTGIVFDAQGAGASAAAGTAAGRADIVVGVEGVGAARVSGAGSAGLVFDAPGEGASRASAAGQQQIVFDVQGVGFESAPTIVSADGSASIVLGMFGDTTQAADASDGGKARSRVRRVPVAYDEEAELMEIMAAALPMLRARGMLWDR